MTYDFSLTDKNVRKAKPGLSDSYYKVVENLNKYFVAIVNESNTKVVDARRLAGETNVNVYFETEENEKFALRVSPWTGQLLTSSIFYNKLEENKIPSPREIKYDASLSVIPFEYQIITFVEHDEIDASQNDKKMGFAYGKILRKIHNIKTNGFGQPKVSNTWFDPSWGEALGRVYLSSKFLKVKGDIYKENESKNIESYFKPERLYISQSYLIHGDVGINNVLFRYVGNEVEVVSVIDPGTLISGDPLFDIAMLLNDNDNFSNATLESYDVSSLSGEENLRMTILRLLCSYWASCYFYSVNRDYKKYVDLTKSLIERLSDHNSV